MIQIHNLTFTYGPDPSPVLKDLNLCIDKGEHVAIIGPNGCGKTTLIRHFNALLRPSSGEVLIDHLSTRDPRNLLEIRRRVGMIFQNPTNQIVGMSVEEDVAFGPGNLGLPADEIRHRVDEALSKVGLSGFQTRSPHTLSGGQKQLLALAGLLAMAPQYIVMDEPTSSLDPVTNENVLALLQELKCQGLGIVQITHNMDEAALADRVLVMNHGEIITDGKPADILSRVDWIKSLGLAPPRITELLWLLHHNGEDVRTNIIGLEGALEEIMRLLIQLRNPNQLGVPGKVDGHV